MKPGLKTFVVGFLIGLLAGGIAARQLGPRMHHGPMSPEKRQERMLQRLTKELSLDPDQRQAIGVILKDGRLKMDEAMSGVRPRFEEIRKDIDGRIREKLTPDQQKRFDVFSEKMHKRMEARRRGFPPPDGDGPGR